MPRAGARRNPQIPKAGRKETDDGHRRDQPLYLILGLALLGLAPFLLMLVTSYVKIVVVTSLVRNALACSRCRPPWS